MTPQEEVARAWLRPLREKWVSPKEIMNSALVEFGGYVLRPQANDTLLVFLPANDEEEGEEAQQQRGTTLNLKRLIALVDKELNRHNEQERYRSPKALARDLIYDYVKRGDSLDSLHRGYMGSGCYGYNACIGGSYHTKEGKWTSVDGWHIVVSEFEGEPCAAIFALKDLYDEIKRELQQGFVIAQPTLF